ncbi:AEC family transporter [Aquibium sp. ELW1220]|uniref:AEC family transporter n=1 Tax=Aquibium sp. ELW1220 TaxID=2976766 RepID=UPI0025B1A3BB|nr:AEC family transporter [Aquibium sp. ELW1220]MDN2582052.1 AEC family transporter [Aquibium sp. ELW1220]
MPAILPLMFPILFLIGLGFLAGRTGYATPAQIDGLAGFVVNFALPAIIFSTFTGQHLGETINLPFLAVYAGGSMIAFAVVFGVMRLVLRRPLTAAAIGALGGTGSNTGFIGFPVASLVIGAPAFVAMPLTMLVENILIIPLALTLAELGRNGGGSVAGLLGGTVRRLAAMPLIWAIFAGTALSFAEVPVPALLSTSVDLLGRASAPVALFVVGGVVASLNRGDVTADIGPVVIGKLVVHPLAVAGMLLVIPGVPAGLAACAIVFSSASMLTIYPVLARRYALETKAAAALIIATVAGLFTVSAVLATLLTRSDGAF